MGIFGALTTAVAGMRAQSYALENVSGNIANSQTTAFKRIDTSFQDLIPDSDPKKQYAGSVNANSRQTNSVQGDIQSASVSTFMAINGQGFFVVQKPDGFADNAPTFGGIDVYTRRGDFQIDQSGFLVNGAGYYLMGIPVDPTTGNPAGSVPEMLRFDSGFLPAQQTTEVSYRLNLASTPKTQTYVSTVPGSELLNPADFSANPINGAPGPAQILGSGSALDPDAAAERTASANIGGAFTSAAGGTLVINGTNIVVPAAANAAAIEALIDAQTGVTGVGASINASNQLVLTSVDADTNITIGGASTLTLLSELGLSSGTTNATNILTQSGASQNQTLTFTVGANPTLTVTFGTGIGEVSTLAELNTALAALVGGTASVDTLTGDITATAGNTTDTILVGGDATARNFGIRTSTGLPANGTVIANDVTSFLNESVAGGSITAYDVSGASANLQIRWAKVDNASLGVGHADTWNLFYQTDATATGTDPAWVNAGVDYTFGANGQLNPTIASTTLTNVTINGVALGDLRIVHGSAGVTQFADSDGVAQVSTLQQNGYPAGQLESVAVSDKGRIVGTYSNGRNVDLAEITLANFTGTNFLKRIDGGAFEATAESGVALYNASGKIQGTSLEASNTDIADEFTKLIVTQQAYSANTRVISTTNQMVQDMLNMLR